MENPPAGSCRPTPASLRWSILRRACLSRSSLQPDYSSQMATKNISRKTTGGYNLISCHPLHDHLAEGSGTLLKSEDITSPRDAYICYSLPVERVLKLVLVQRMDCVDLNDFEISTRYDIDTTGLVCCWPTEDVLAYFCVNNPNLFRSKRVLELGSGYGLAGLAIAATTNACEVVISDGNPRVVDYIQRNINVNAGVFGDTRVKSRTLHWDQEQDSDIHNSFDIIVASDCTFFKEFHKSLARTIKSLLKYSETSEALFLSPKRGDSLDKFLEKIKEIGFCFELVENYDSKVWNIHQKLLNGGDPTWPNYDEDHCYPLMWKVKDMFSSGHRIYYGEKSAAINSKKVLSTDQDHPTIHMYYF